MRFDMRWFGWIGVWVALGSVSFGGNQPVCSFDGGVLEPLLKILPGTRTRVVTPDLGALMATIERIKEAVSRLTPEEIKAEAHKWESEVIGRQGHHSGMNDTPDLRLKRVRKVSDFRDLSQTLYGVIQLSLMRPGRYPPEKIEHTLRIIMVLDRYSTIQLGSAGSTNP